jgi:hypothetical protein
MIHGGFLLRVMRKTRDGTFSETAAPVVDPLATPTYAAVSHHPDRIARAAW